MSTDHGPVTQKSISEIAKYLKNLIPANIPEFYELNPIFDSIANEENIRNGVIAYRDYLYLFCDHLISDGSSYFKLKKNPKTATDYPFLYSITDLLSDIGYNGKLTESGKSLVVSELPSFTGLIDSNGNRKKPKNSATMLSVCLRFLALCGFEFTGIDLEAKSVKLKEGQLIEVSYPNAPSLLIGLRVMSIADIELRVKRYKNDYHHDNLLRCDYRLIQARAIDMLEVLKDFSYPLEENVREFALGLHKHYIDLGMTCVIIASTFEVHLAYTYIKNSPRSLSSRDIYQKRVWEFAVSTRNGHSLVVRAKKTDKYPEVIEKLALPLQKKIEIGYGCDRKLRNEPCQGGCEGLRFPLDETILDISTDIKMWLDEEVSYKKRK